MIDIFRRLRQSKKEIEREQQELHQLYGKEDLLTEEKKKPSLTPPQKIPRKATTKKVRQRKKSGKVKPSSRVEKYKVLFKDVLRDLDAELHALRSRRRRLEARLAEFSNALGSTQNKEIELRDKISALMKKETLLMKRRSTAKDEVMEVTKKIEKVSSIERQLREE